MQTRRFVDLFAGCGGLSLGLSMAGIRGVFAIERDEMAFETFAHNLVLDSSPQAYRFDWPEWLEQRAWGIDEILDKHRDQLEQLQGTVDILAGGPPCQGFSFSGRRVEDDPRNRLFEKYVEVVKAVMPAALVLENVPGMRVAHKLATVTPPQGEAKLSRKSFYEKLTDSLDAAGYDVRGILIDASRFGVPQKRSRLIAIGIQKDLTKFLQGGIERAFELIESERLKQLSDLGLGEVVSALDAISDLEIGNRPLAACTDAQSRSGYFEVTPSVAETTFQRLMQEGASGVPNSLRLARHRTEVRDRFARIIAECVDLHPEVTRVFHRELTRLKVMFCGLCLGQDMRDLPFRFGYC